MHIWQMTAPMVMETLACVSKQGQELAVVLRYTCEGCSEWQDNEAEK